MLARENILKKRKEKEKLKTLKRSSGGIYFLFFLQVKKRKI